MSDWSQALSHHPGGGGAPATISGNRALQIEEVLIFEQDVPGRCGVDLPEPASGKSRLDGLRIQTRAMENHLLFAPGVELQDEDYAQARSRFRTKLLRKGPSPQGWTPTRPPGCWVSPRR